MKDNETLTSISEKTNISVNAIMRENQLVNQQVRPGQVLILPIER